MLSMFENHFLLNFAAASEIDMFMHKRAKMLLTFNGQAQIRLYGDENIK